MKVIITGTTGMVGEGVLLVCLDHPAVSQVLSVSRKPQGRQHPKLQEYVVPDFQSLKEGDPNLAGYDACFFCAGVSSVGMNEADYSRVTFDTTLAFARAVGPQPAMTFIYVSGSGTDSSEQGRSMWARVKGKTENAILSLPFKRAFAFRPAALKAMPGQKHLPKFYRYGSWLLPLFSLFPGYYSTLEAVGLAMIQAARNGYEKKVVEVKDIRELARREAADH